MKLFRKSMSVFLAVLMLMTACIPAFHGAAAVVVYSEQYGALATLLANEHVRNLENYEIEHKKSEDIVTEGFHTDAGAFAYSHTVYAKDDVENSILKAANRFYYIAESVMSYNYGVGIYTADLLYKEVLSNVKSYFDTVKESGWFDMNNQPANPLMSERDKYYEVLERLGGRFDKDNLITMGVKYYYNEDVDFYLNVYGERYYPTDDELAVYEEAYADLFDAGVVEPTINDMTERGINFVKASPYDYYNVETVISYFMGTGTYMNAGNWYHDFNFIVNTDTETVLMNMDSLDSYADPIITVTTGIYCFRYQRQYAANGTTAQYFFKQVNMDDIFVRYGTEYDLARNPVKLSYLEEGEGTIGQSAYLFTVEHKDETTIPTMIAMNNTFNGVFTSRPAAEYVGEYYVGNTWDSQFLLFTNDQLEHLDEYKQTVNQIDLFVLRQYAESLTQLYSNEVLVHLFPGTIGNIKTMQYLATSGKQAPTRTVRGTATYTGDIKKLDSIVYQFDALFTNEDVMATINMFLGDTMDELFAGTLAEGNTYNTAQDLVKVLLKGMLYSDDMCTTVVSAIYPMIANLLLDLFASAEGFANTLNSLVDWALNSLDAALTPGDLADYLTEYPSAYAALKAAGSSMDSWNNVRWGNVTWEKRDGTKITDRETFAAALSATFRGLRVAVLCLFCDDSYWSLELLGGLAGIVEQAGYKDLILPLLEALGLEQASSAVNNDNLAAGLCYSADDYRVRARNERLDGDSYLMDILMPLLKWVEEIVAIKPIETVCNLLPNLVNFIIRDTGDNLLDCIGKVELDIEIFFGAGSVYSTSIADLLGDIAAGLDSLNHLLADMIDFSTKDEDGNDIPYYLPKIHEKKLIECGTVNEKHTVDVEHPGYVFLFLLRFVLTAVGYRYDINNAKLPYVIECFGIDMDSELFLGMKFGDLIYNIMLHPDEALCALLELFYSNENGNYYEYIDYTYPLDPINYYTDTLLNPSLNPTLSYGAKVVYSDLWTQEMATEVVNDLGPLADNVLKLIGIEGMENGLGAFLEDLIYGYISNDTVNMLFNLLYQLLSGVDGTLGDINIIALLDHIFSVEFTPDRAARRVYMMLGYEPEVVIPEEGTTPPAEGEGNNSETETEEPLKPYTALYSMPTWEDVFMPFTYDPDLNEDVRVLTDANFNWGIDEAEKHGLTKGEAFIRVLSALLSPASFIFEFLMLDQPLNVFGLVSLPSYAGYQYSFIALLELLTCPADKIVSYREYYEKTIILKETGEQANIDLAECNTFYYFLRPILGLVEKAIADPVSTVFNLLPNLMFFISIGGMNDLVNNLVHFAYILLDIVKPIFNAYDLVNSLLSNIDLGGFVLNLSLPLDIDFNSIISSLLGSMLGELIVLGTREVVDENGNVTEENITLTLPYIDFYTLCAGNLERFESKEMRRIVRLDAAGGGDLLTALLRLVISVLFIDDNIDALIYLLLNVSSNLDEYDKETMQMLVSELGVLMEDFDTADIVMLVLYHLITKLTSLSTTLVDLLADSGLTIMDLVAVFGQIEGVEDVGLIIDFIGSLGGDDEYQPDNNEDGIPDDPQSGGGIDNGTAAMSIFDKIKAFFQKIILFIKKTFGFA